MIKIDPQLINAELECVGQKIDMFTSYARKIQWQDDTRRATCDADDVVMTCIEKLTTNLHNGNSELATTVKHARARFMIMIQGYLLNLRKKRDRVYSDNATLELHSVDSTIAKALLEVMCDRLRPTDALLLQRCADGEHLTDVIKDGDVTKLQVQRLRQRVRKELENKESHRPQYYDGSQHYGF